MKRSLKEAAKKNDKETCMILAKEILRARKSINKIYTSKAHINSVQLQMKNQLGNDNLINFVAKLFHEMQLYFSNITSCGRIVQIH